MSQGVAQSAVRRAKRRVVGTRAAAAAGGEAMPPRPVAATAAVAAAAVEMAADTVVAMPATDLAETCSRPPARHAASRPVFRSNLVATSQCTARSASRWYAAVVAAAADTPSL